MPAKPITTDKARALLRTLFPDDLLKVMERDGVAAVYFNDSAQARFFGPTWEAVIVDAVRTQFKT